MAANADLYELLGHALAGPEVGAVKPLIAVYDRDQGDLGEVVALGEHLGADQDVCVSLCDALERPLPGRLAAHGVAVDAQHPDLWEVLLGRGGS